MVVQRTKRFKSDPKLRRFRRQMSKSAKKCIGANVDESNYKFTHLHSQGLLKLYSKCKFSFALIFHNFHVIYCGRQVEGILTSESWIESKKERDALTYHISPHFSLKRSVRQERLFSNMSPRCRTRRSVFRKRVITKSWGCPQAVWLSSPDDPRGIKSGLVYPGWPTSLKHRGRIW